MASNISKFIAGAVLVIAIGGFIYWSSSQNSSASAGPGSDTSAPSEIVNPGAEQSSPGTAVSGSTGSDTGAGSAGGSPSAGEAGSGGSASSAGDSGNPAGANSGNNGNGSGAVSSGHYKNGTYTGTVSNVIYGNVQVSATIVGGKITAVNFLQYPDDPGHTQEVSRMAIPALTQEAIASQSANVDIVSGATQTSEAFRESLRSALAQAQA